MAFYAHDDLNNRVETLSKEGIYALLAAAIQQGQLPQIDQNTAFVTMIKSIVDGKAYKQAYCTQAQYNELVAAGTVEGNTMYIITDDDSYTTLVNMINQLNENVSNYIDSLDDINANINYTKIDNEVVGRKWFYNLGDDRNAFNEYDYASRTNIVSKDNIGDDDHSKTTTVEQTYEMVRINYKSTNTDDPIENEIFLNEDGLVISKGELGFKTPDQQSYIWLAPTNEGRLKQDINTIAVLEDFGQMQSKTAAINKLGLYAIKVSYVDGSTTTYATVMLSVTHTQDTSIFSTPVPNSSGAAYVILDALGMTLRARSCTIEDIRLVVAY